MIAIVVMDKGFVSVGSYTEGEKWCRLDNAAVLRRWGTSAGLGQIAKDGPTSSTILDRTPTEKIPMHAIVKIIECDEEKWKKALDL